MTSTPAELAKFVLYIRNILCVNDDLHGLKVCWQWINPPILCVIFIKVVLAGSQFTGLIKMLKPLLDIKRTYAERSSHLYFGC